MFVFLFQAALEDVLQRSKAFEDQLNHTIQWLTEANSKAGANRDVSVLVEGVLRQTEQHKVTRQRGLLTNQTNTCCCIM